MACNRTFQIAAPLALTFLLPLAPGCGPTHHAAPVISSFTASPSTIHTGQSALLAWSATNADTFSITPGVGTVSGSSTDVSPSATTTYTLTASGPGGTVTATAVVTVTSLASATWTWVSGASTVNAAAVPGTEGTPAAGNVPGNRYGSGSWRDAAGNLWLFGGMSYNQFWDGSIYNDLWKFDGADWTWVSGGTAANPSGVYGTLGTGAVGNVPGGREAMVTWTDGSGHFWLFGGLGFDSLGTQGYLNDLWKFDGTTWTWVAGSKLANPIGVYGTLGTAAPGNFPGGRVGARGWRDAAGNFYVFGGYIATATGNGGWVNDVWKFDGAAWTWVAGSQTLNLAGSYGTRGTAASGNAPGARDGGATWEDSKGVFWVFGGFGYDSAGAQDVLGDLWKFDGTGWTWVAGSTLVKPSGVYGTQGSPAAANAPGGRVACFAWVDADDALWLFGGSGYDSAGTNGYLNDLWKFDGTAWTWVSGSSVADPAGVYGTLGAGASADIPGGRMDGAAWRDAEGALWLFGGTGQDSTGTFGGLNDLWKATLD